jgi:HK97 family phage major capsid protein
MVPAPSVTDHLVTIPVTQSGYKYMEETTYTNNAAEVSEGSTFGEAALALTERSQTVEKVAVWLPMTDEQLEDEPGARAYVEARLENMLRQRIDLQVLAGDGNTPNLLGTVNKVGIQTQALGADTLLDASYKLFTTIRTDGFAEPSVAFLRAASWQPVMLLKTADGQYIYGNPASGGPSTLWGVPVVQTQAAPSGKLVTGDYANYAFLGVKRGIDVQVTNSHNTDFINGKQAVRVDTRLVMVHIRPKAFGVVTGV